MPSYNCARSVLNSSCSSICSIGKTEVDLNPVHILYFETGLLGLIVFFICNEYYSECNELFSSANVAVTDETPGGGKDSAAFIVQ